VAKFRESCLAVVCAAGGILISQAVRLPTRWPTCCLLAHGRSMGPTGVNGLAAGGGPAYWAAAGRLGERETDRELKLGAILNTIQSSLPPPYLHIMHTYRHPPQGCAMGPPMWPWRCGLTGPPCKRSGVEWSTRARKCSDGH